MPFNRQTFPEWLPLAVAVALVTIAFALGLGNHGPIPSMEPRFAVAVQQMLAHHQWLVPEKNGLPYIEYPPFYYWMALVLAKAGLPILPAIRLPNLIALWLWVVAVYGLARHLLPRLPRWLLPAAGLAAPAVLFNFFIAQSDGWLAAGVALALWGYLRHRARARGGFPWMLWIGAAIAVFAKGPVGLVVVGLAVGGDLLIEAAATTGGWRALPLTIFRLAPLRGLLITFTPLAAWYLACGLVVGWEFVRAAFVYGNITRFLAGAGGHHNPWWLFAKTFWADYFPWSLAAPFGLVLAATRLRKRGARLAFAWAVTTLIFFSISASKQSKYILPAAPAFVALGLLALGTTARRLKRGQTPFSRRKMGSVPFLGFGWSCLILIIFVVLVGAWLPFKGPKIDDDAAYAKFKRHLVQEPGQLFMYRWPKSLVLWQLGAPMPWLRDAQDLYAAIQTGKLKPGDYVLVSQTDLPAKRPGPFRLAPAPAPPYFKRVMRLSTKGGILVYRVLPGARTAALPKTPTPPPAPWWSRFDTD
jgi:4-amino-4-deoxy-L-arabinose transferase-like glycosyltransferase